MVTGDQRAPVVDLRAARIDRLAHALTAALESGHVIDDTSEVASVDEWRAAARQAARDHGWRVRTGVAPDGSRVWAVRLDRATTEQDRDVLTRRLSYLGALLSP
jgi:hypothetical protein